MLDHLLPNLNYFLLLTPLYLKNKIITLSIDMG